MTDSDGRFTIDGLGTNDLLELTVEAIGYKDSSIKVIGRDVKTAYSRDPFDSGEQIAVHGRNFQATLVASDRNTIHNRHRVLKDEQVNRKPVSTAEKEMFDAIDNPSPEQRKGNDRKPQDAEQSVPAQGDATTTGNVSGTEKSSPTQRPDTSNGESMDLFQEVVPRDP